MSKQAGFSVSVRSETHKKLQTRLPFTRKQITREQYTQDTLFLSGDLDFDPMTLIYDLDLCFLKMYM